MSPGTYDLILMDIQMPNMDGYTASRKIRGMEREDAKAIPIIALTANAFDEDKKKALECGMDGFVSKPIVIEELISILQKNLDQRSVIEEEIRSQGMVGIFLRTDKDKPSYRFYMKNGYKDLELHVNLDKSC